MYNKVVLAVVQNVLSAQGKPVTGKTNFKSLGATSTDVNWVLFETEQRLHVQLPEAAITPESTINDLVKSVVEHHD
ncbi:MAG TPA: phosphopantetheine-binding protein [Cyclobacteriaceae bacterium]|nr:phosphopantetheine-binding protein [Cyclobacteriaceae bacterium]